MPGDIPARVLPVPRRKMGEWKPKTKSNLLHSQNYEKEKNSTGQDSSWPALPFEMGFVRESLSSQGEGKTYWPIPGRLVYLSWASIVGQISPNPLSTSVTSASTA